MYEIFRDRNKRSECGTVERIIDHRYRARIEFSANISNFIVHEAGKRVWNVSSRNITGQLRFTFPAHQIICYNIKHLCRSTISLQVCYSGVLSWPSGGDTFTKISLCAVSFERLANFSARRRARFASRMLSPFKGAEGRTGTRLVFNGAWLFRIWHMDVLYIYTKSTLENSGRVPG